MLGGDRFATVMIDLGAAGQLCRVSQIDASVRALAS
jgi:hypothetical protein